MKKFLVVLILAALLLTLCACDSVPSTRFLSASQVDSLTKKCPNPQAEVTINYTVSGKDIEAKITYDLLLSQTPLATLKFIELVNDGFYNDSIMDSYDSTNHYMTLGRYLYKPSQIQQDNKLTYYRNPLEGSFKGEFKSNNYKQPKEGYAQFDILSLAMYHDAWTETNNTFDSANGYLVMALAKKSLNSDNYAVFAHWNTLRLKEGDSAEKVYTAAENAPSSDFISHLAGFVSKASKTVYDDASETNSTSLQLMSNPVTVQIRMLGDYDWSKLPKVGK